jgi:hypothetical protein
MEKLDSEQIYVQKIGYEVYDDVIDKLPGLLGDVPELYKYACLILIGQHLVSRGIAGTMLNTDVATGMAIHEVSSRKIMGITNKMVEASVMAQAMGEQDE